MLNSSNARVPKGTAIVLAIIAAIVPIYWTGIGGALIAACVGVAAAIIASSAFSKGANESERSLEGSVQLEGVLDSSQLDAMDGGPKPQVRSIPERNGKLVIVIALVASLLTSGIVLATTGGRGIHFYLGTSPFSATTPTKTNKVPQKTQTTNPTDEQYGWDDTYTEEWYYPDETYDEGEAEEVQPEEQDTSQPATPDNTGTGEDSTPTNQEPQGNVETGDSAQPTTDQATPQDAPAAADDQAA